jgi:hypothetical protein
MTDGADGHRLHGERHWQNLLQHRHVGVEIATGAVGGQRQQPLRSAVASCGPPIWHQLAEREDAAQPFRHACCMQLLE